MPDEPADSGNRVTTALVYRTVDDLGKRMDTHFDAINRRLDRADRVEDRVDGHERTLADHEGRLVTAERERAELARLAERTAVERSTWWRGQLPALCGIAIALGALLYNVL